MSDNDHVNIQLYSCIDPDIFVEPHIDQWRKNDQGPKL